MSKLVRTAAAGIAVALWSMNAVGADTRNEARLDIAPGGNLNLVSNGGSITLHAGAGRQISGVYITHSDKVEVDRIVTPDKMRVAVRSHVVPDQKPSADESRVDYDLTVPAGVSVTITTATAPITVDGISGDLDLSSETGQITVSNVSKVHVHVRGVTAPVSLSHISNGHVEVTSSGGTVQLVDVIGPKVSVGTANGNISYRGDCSGGGEYSLTTHSGAIDVSLPETASFDLSARSGPGLVQNDFPLKEKSHPAYVPKAGSSFTGTSNSGSSSIELQSFSGRIRVKKQ
jgi:Putative adhesin